MADEVLYEHELLPFDRHARGGFKGQQAPDDLLQHLAADTSRVAHTEAPQVALECAASTVFIDP